MVLIGSSDFYDKAGGGGGGGIIMVYTDEKLEGIEFSGISVKGGYGANVSRAQGGKGGDGKAMVSSIGDGLSTIYWESV